MMSKKNIKNRQQRDTSNIVDIQNVDLDRADEFLLSAKKKKLEDTYRDEDQEDLLFDEESKEMATDVSDTSKTALRGKLESSRSNLKHKPVRIDGQKDIKLGTKFKFKRRNNSLVIDKIVADNNKQKHGLSNKKNISYRNKIKEINTNENQTVLIKDKISDIRELSTDTAKTSMNIVNYNNKTVQTWEDKLSKSSTSKSKQLKNITQRHREIKESKNNSRMLGLNINNNKHTSENKTTQRSQLNVGKPSTKMQVIRTSNQHSSPKVDRNNLDTVRAVRGNKMPDFSTNTQETSNKDVQRNHLDVIRPALLECTSESDHSHRRPIRVNGTNLRLKMLERLQAARSHYTSSQHRRGRR